MNNSFKLRFTEKSEKELELLEKDASKFRHFKAVAKCLYFMQTNLKHSCLNTHKYDEISGPDGQEVFESYTENKTPGAYRIFWHYGPARKEITILRICKHP